MVEIRLWKNFSKSQNSTIRPDNELAPQPYDTMQVSIKEDTSIESPSFILAGTIEFDYNYCYVPTFKHYYYIADIIVLANSRYEIVCTQDLLATYRDELAQNEVYVEYSNSAYDTMIPDTRRQMTNDVTTARETHKLVSETSGTYVLTVAGVNSDAQVGFTTAYAVSNVVFEDINAWLYNSSIATQLRNIFGDPYKAIVSAHWVPWSLYTGGTTIYVGDNDTTYEAGGLHSETTQSALVFNLSIPWINHDWRDFQPYSILQLYLPFYGTVNLDAARLKGQSTITVRVIKDAITGEINYTVVSGTDFKEVYKVDCAVQLPIGQQSGGKLQGIAEFVGGTGAFIGAAAAMSGGVTAAGALAAAGGAGAAIKGELTFFSESASGRGGTGGFASFNQILKTSQTDVLRYATLTMFSHGFSATDSSIKRYLGLPLFQVRRIGTLSGYIQGYNANLQLTCLAKDRAVIESYVNSGFYFY